MSFQKEMVGSLEAGGRCIALRMGVTYPLSNGQKDTHHAFVTIGVHPDTEAIGARARKLLRPMPDGFEERVEVDYGTGHYETHSVLHMLRVAGSVS